MIFIKLKKLTSVSIIVVSFLFLAQASYADNSEIVLPEIQGLHSKFKLSLGPSGLSTLAWMVEHSDEKEFSQLVEQVERVNVNFFSVSGPVKDVYQGFEQSFSLLNSYSWQKIVTVNDKSEKILMYASVKDHIINGLSVFVIDGGEAFFVNLSGEIDTALVSVLVKNARMRAK